MLMTLLFSIGIPALYVLIDMYVSRNYWFKTRNLPLAKHWVDCYNCSTTTKHRRVCNKGKVAHRKLNAVMYIFLWPFVGVAGLIKDFYNVPEKKLGKDRDALVNDIRQLEMARDDFDRDSETYSVMMQIIKEKEKKLEAMR